EAVFRLAEGIRDSCKNLNLIGLMAMPPFFEDPEMARPYFRRLRGISDSLALYGYRLGELSMGMSNDFEAAIEEGATMVRIGSEIFGQR
ncbi:MAG: alanine racemase, partial [Nitrospirae bacterium]|nr:alanine racemase [Nitrospirota bacterium]